MSGPEERATCANCGREHPASAFDSAGWCSGCRREVVRRATVVAHALGGLALVLVGLWVIVLVQPGARFVVLWLVLVGLIYFVVFKLARRVAFEVIRSRGVSPPEAE